MIWNRISMVCLAAVSATACATIPRSAVTAPNLVPIAGTPAPARGKLYADCVGQAANTGHFDRTDNASTHLLRFTCSGAPARALFEALKDWSAAQKSEWSADGRTWRATARVQRDLFGTDYCSSDGGSDYVCAITTNVGGFLAG